MGMVSVSTLLSARLLNEPLDILLCYKLLLRRGLPEAGAQGLSHAISLLSAIFGNGEAGMKQYHASLLKYIAA
ncbi:MAG: hypothetical protein PUC76_04275 [Clostridia bacterium]|nr:hypothetical protein [Clostridia bacterium]